MSDLDTTETVDFREFMTTPLDQFIVPRILLPEGHYFAEGTEVDHGQGSPQKNPDGSPRLGSNGKQLEGNLYWVFYYQLTQPGPDITPEGLKLLEEVNLRNYEFPRRPDPGFYPRGPGMFWITRRSLEAGFFRNFIFSCGFDTAARPLDEFIPEYRGTQLLVGITQEVSQSNAERKYNQVVSLSGVANPLNQ